MAFAERLIGLEQYGDWKVMELIPPDFACVNSFPHHATTVPDGFVIPHDPDSPAKARFIHEE
jgi:hypothetical protein